MKDKLVDVIYNLENNNVDILEVIDNEDLQYSLSRQTFYRKCYDNANLVSGVKYTKIDKSFKDMIEAKEKLKKMFDVTDEGITGLLNQLTGLNNNQDKLLKRCKLLLYHIWKTYKDLNDKDLLGIEELGTDIEIYFSNCIEGEDK